MWSEATRWILRNATVRLQILLQWCSQSIWCLESQHWLTFSHTPHNTHKKLSIYYCMRTWSQKAFWKPRTPPPGVVPRAVCPARHLTTSMSCSCAACPTALQGFFLQYQRRKWKCFHSLVFPEHCKGIGMDRDATSLCLLCKPGAGMISSAGACVIIFVGTPSDDWRLYYGISYMIPWQLLLTH